MSKIGRDLCKVIIIDNCPENFKLQPLNGLEIKTWEDDLMDTQLIDLTKLLKDIALIHPHDVRSLFKKIKEQFTSLILKKEPRPYSMIDVATIPLDK